MTFPRQLCRNRLSFHCLDWQPRSIAWPRWGNEIRSVKWFQQWSEVGITRALTLNELIAHLSQSSIDEIFIGISDTLEGSLEVWTRSEGGPVFLCSGSNVVVFSQPLGSNEIQFSTLSIDELDSWRLKAQEEFPEIRVSFMRFYKYVCYPNDYDYAPPAVNKVSAFFKAEDNQVSPCCLLIELSTGSTLGIDAFADDGLSLFLDNQVKVFREHHGDFLGLTESVLWSR